MQALIDDLNVGAMLAYCYVLPLFSGELKFQLLCCACIVFAVTGNFGVFQAPMAYGVV